MDLVKECFTSNILSRATQFISWQKPPLNYFKLNVEGSAFGNPGRAGVGGVVH